MFDAPSDDPRVTVRTRGLPDADGTCVVYWMQRTHRGEDNPALDVAIAAGNALRKPVVVFFGLLPFVAGGNLRHYRFLVDGLPDVGAALRRRRVGFVVRRYPHHRLLPFVERLRPALVVGDENPLRQAEAWRERVSIELRAPFWTVDADVVVPSRLIHAEQYAARTIRPRLQRHLARFLVVPPETHAHVAWHAPASIETATAGAGAGADLLEGLPIDDSVAPVAGLRGGTTEARRRLRAFIETRMARYDSDRNRPECDGTSMLSPYLHFGHIGPREVALAVRDADVPAAASEVFLEQLVVRRELAVNFVLFNRDYDRLAGCEPWARRTLAQHERDERAALYTPEQLEAAATADPLWNAAQAQMVTTGWMHGYLRMYWAKRLLEWTRTADEAHRIAVRLNDRYEVDGRDPNGYANIAWAIGGKHDRPWPPRPIFGSVRSMSHQRTMRKFDAQRYIARFGPPAPGDV